jgi:small-conductance mechanosensitive channel
MEWLDRAISAAVVVALALGVAKLADRALVRRLERTPEALTRYRVLRRSIVATIVAVGILSALLVVPTFRAVAGSILASSAVVALIVGLAAQATLSNFVAGILIAFTQPLRLGDRVDVGAASGTVEEIALTYTRIRAPEGDLFFVPNAKLASDTIRNATIASSEHLARVSLSVPLSTDSDWVLGMLVEEAQKAPGSMSEKQPTAALSQLEAASMTVSVEAWARTAGEAAALASAIRRAAHARLRERGTAV